MPEPATATATADAEVSGARLGGRPATPAAAPPATLPAWLRKLATESWEAELLVSGFAIVGTAQLVGLTEPMAEWLLFNVRAAALTYVQWVLVYFGLGCVVLPLVFVAHFAIRAFWVGMVGLSSVFPGGIGPERIASMPEAFVDEVRTRYPSLPQLIDRTDRIASTLFIVAALLSMVFVSIALVLAVTIALALGLDVATGGVVRFEWVVWGVVAAVVALWLASMLLLLPRVRERPWATPAYLALSRGMRKVTYTVFEYPATYLQTVLITNRKWGASSIPVIVGGYLLLVPAMGYVMTRPMMLALSDSDRADRDATDAHRYLPSRYREAWPEDYIPVSPYVAAEALAPGEELVVYAPMLGEDDFRSAGGYTGPAAPAGLSADAARDFRRARALARDSAYYRFEINGERVVPVDFVWYRPAGLHDGVRAVLPVGPEVPERFRVSVSTRGRDDGWVERARIPMRRVRG